MIDKDELIIDDETINKIGLQLSDKQLIAQNSCHARVFEYPDLENVYVMEADIYGNSMPKNSCFLAFYGNHGLLGVPIEVETLKNAGVEDIQKIVENGREG